MFLIIYEFRIDFLVQAEPNQTAFMNQILHFARTILIHRLVLFFHCIQLNFSMRSMFSMFQDKIESANFKLTHENVFDLAHLN